MESKGQKGSSSSSSFTADLFGTKEPQQSSSSGIFASIFPPPSKMVGRGTTSSEAYGNPAWNNKQGSPSVSSRFEPLHYRGRILGSGMLPPDQYARLTEAASCNIPNKARSSVFPEQRTEPCHLSSSLYYGGQDVYSRFSSNQTSGSYPIIKKDRPGEDDANGNNPQDASRGNWWQGSLYY